MTRIYLDANASLPMDRDILLSYQWALKECWANASSTHREGQAAKALLSESRKKIADCLSVTSKEVTFFSCATEALATLIYGLLVRSPENEIITSCVEHAAVWQTLRDIAKQKKALVTFAEVGEEGAVSPKQLTKLITPKTSGICLMSVNNETGVMTDLENVAYLAKENSIPLLVDGVAHLGKEELIWQEGISAWCFSSYKIHGPCGVGICVTKPNVSFSPLFSGGGQEFGRRGGSENVPAIYACALAFERAYKEAKQRAHVMRTLRDLFEKRLFEKIPFLAINGTKTRVSNTSNVAFQGVDGETLLIQLSQAGVSASRGAACGAGAMEPSRVLLTMGYSQDRAASSLRFSFSYETTPDEIEKAAQIVIKAVSDQLQLSDRLN
jgi:cysteine desulfurase